MTQPPRAVLFDLDDTILVAFGPSASQWRRVIGASAGALGGLAATVLIDAIEDTSRALWADPGRHKYWRQRIGEARRRIVATAFAELASAGHAVPGRAVSDALADAYNAMHEAELRMFPGAHETVDGLRERGVRLALVTNGAAAPQRAKLVRFALEHRFDHVQIEGEHGFGKPDERAYLHTMEALGVTAGETISSKLNWDATWKRAPAISGD